MKFQLILIFTLLVSCGKTVIEESDPPAADTNPDPRKATYYSGDITVKEGKAISVNGTDFFSQNVASGYTFSLINKPSFLSIDTNTAALSGEPQENGLFEAIKIRATLIADNSQTIDSNSFSIAVNGDPLRQYAWHLKNTGQKAFSSIAGTSGFDLNVYDVLKDGYTGDGVRIAISDSGVEVKHDDLYDNQLSGEHKDYSLAAPYVSTPVPTNFHGTAVAGIIAAVGWNNFGSIGVAPEAKFAGFQFLDSPQSSSIMVDQASGDFDIFNYSYGDFIYEDTRSDSTYLDQLRYQAITQDKIYVKASGNEFFYVEDGVCASHNANFPYENESPFIIIVGSIHADGAKASYSNAGSNLWISAPGGEDGESMGPAIITTDLRTCFKGNSIAGTYSSNDLEYNNALNLQCDYTATMNGTSSATPNVTGVIALMREVNPNLKMRDVKHILASTAIQIDASHDENLNYFGKAHPSEASTSCTVNLSLANHEYEQGWVTNKANYKFNNFYGFGLIDAKAAVNMAKTYTSTLGTQVEMNPNFSNATYRSAPSKPIPDADKDGATDTITIASGINYTIETIQVKVQISHPRSGQIGIELTGPGPSGTKSILMNVNNSFLFDNDSNLNIVLTTNAFYGETVNGTWEIKVIDGLASHTGTLVQWDMNVLGH